MRWANRIPPSLRFVAVGALAAATHYLVALGAHHAMSLSPWLANALGFVVAFGVSYLGHFTWTFAAQAHVQTQTQTQTHRQSLPRFLGVAIAAQLANQALTALFLQALAWPFALSLGLALLLVALGTYVLSARWAFAGKV